MVVSLEHLMLPTHLTLFDAAEPLVAAVHGVWRWWWLVTLAEIIRDLAWQIITFAATADTSCLSIASLPEMSECVNGGKDYHKRADRSCPYVSLDDVVVHSRRSLCYQEREWKHTAICTTGYAHHSVNNEPAVFPSRISHLFIDIQGRTIINAQTVHALTSHLMMLLSTAVGRCVTRSVNGESPHDTAICTTGYAHHSVNNEPAVFAIWDLAPFH
nr:hypothetical protein [Tanacetum cinerariifolium]